MSKIRELLSLAKVVATFKSEYSSLLGKFTIHDLTIDRADSDASVPVNSPGIYVYWNEIHGVIKVGKSLSNSKARALQHIRDNTQNEALEMKTIKNESTTHLLLFNIALEKDMHWIPGLELYMEKNLHPLIPSQRNG